MTSTIEETLVAHGKTLKQWNAYRNYIQLKYGRPADFDAFVSLPGDDATLRTAVNVDRAYRERGGNIR